MGLFARLFGNRNQHPDIDFTPEEQAYVFDAAGLVDSGPRNGTPPGPRENYEALKTLARFAAQENLTISAVFTGRPLREASDGAVYKNVRVRYAEKRDAVRKLLLNMAQSGGGRPTLVVTSDAELERDILARRGLCMRASTFKKALDTRDRDDREPRAPRQNRGANNQHARREPQKKTAPAEANGNDAPRKEILDLIDPL